jgi:hypothetical protein
MLLGRAQGPARIVTLHAAPNSFRFSELLGFVRDLQTGRTDIRQHCSDRFKITCIRENITHRIALADDKDAQAPVPVAVVLLSHMIPILLDAYAFQAIWIAYP